jgi:uncharacterized protein (DUF1800 family)
MHSPIARRLRAVSLAAILGAAVVISSSGVESKDAIPTDDAAIVHALDRLTFGATVRDVERVKRMGLPRWIKEQLNPSTIDDSRVEARLAGFETLDLASNVIARDYERPARQERLRARRDQGDDGQAQSAPAGPFDSPAREAGSLRAGEPDRPARGRLSDAQMKNRLVLTELSEAKLLRAIYSERQLEEVLVDFWFNHFNVFAGKGQTRVYITEYERTAIRPHVLGRFRDLLEATAKSPAMLFYLDNWISSAPAHSTRLSDGSARSGQAAAVRARQANIAQPPRRTRGLNENYARELLELHTLGVDGGYTQTDVVNVARAFTGWTIRLRASRFGGQVGGQIDPNDDMGFRFAPAMHDAGAKTVLGETIKAGGGEQDGERVLDILAAHPSTARFIATKLARRFVSDQPPQALVDRAAARFRATGGDLREVVRTIVASPELFAAEARGAKVKTPLEFVASALRATGADVERATVLIRVLRDLGMPSYFCQPPTGYDETAETWVSSGALVSRMNFAVDLTGGKLRGISVPAGTSELTALRDHVQQSLLFGRASQSTLATMARATTPAHTLALAIGSPEFQRR